MYLLQIITKKTIESPQLLEILPCTPEGQERQYYEEESFLDPSKNLITNMAPQSYTFGKIFNTPNSRAPNMNQQQQNTNYNINNYNNGGFRQMNQYPLSSNNNKGNNY